MSTERKLLDHLARISRRVDALEDEVRRPSLGVETVAEHVEKMWRRVEALERKLAGIAEHGAGERFSAIYKRLDALEASAS